jgi:5-methyltetrahydrofolate--homocysteine methyltransferase
VNYEDGDGPESRFTKTMELVAEHGAAVVALTIDEEGQARTAEKKVEIAERLIADITGNWGVDESSILIDTLTFTICTGQEESRKDGIETIEAIRLLKQKHPDVQTTLDFRTSRSGLNPAARQVLNSVFLHECRRPGLTSAIVHASKILPMNRIDEKQREVALDLVYDRRREGYDPLQELMADVRGRIGGLVEGVPCRRTGETASAGTSCPAHRRRRTQRTGGRPRRGDDPRSRRWPSSTRTCWRV